MATATDVRTEERYEAPTIEEQRRDTGLAAFWLLRLGFTVAPIAAGVDKFFEWMVNWDQYLWPQVADALPGSAQQLMYVVGGIEIAAGVVVLLAPRIGGWLVAAWLAAITANLVAMGIDQGEYWDIALRDAGLMMGAISLALLAHKYSPRRELTMPRRGTAGARR